MFMVVAVGVVDIQLLTRVERRFIIGEPRSKTLGQVEREVVHILLTHALDCSAIAILNH
jgi:hypothetical protein